MLLFLLIDLNEIHRQKKPNSSKATFIDDMSTHDGKIGVFTHSS